MRTTIRLPDGLLERAKRYAAERHSTLTQVIEHSLRLTLDEGKRAPTKQPVRLPTFRGRGLQPGVDLDDSAALLEVMERQDAAARR